MLRQAALALSAGRVVLGSAMLIAPELVARGWVGEIASREGAQALTRTVGIRDLVLGAGSSSAILRDSEEAAAWLAGGAACDLADIGATIAARRELPATGVATILVLATGSALVCALAAAEERS